MNEGFSFRCHSDMGIPVFWASPFPKPWWYGYPVQPKPAEVIEKGMPISLGFWEWGCPYHYRQRHFRNEKKLGRVNFRKDFRDCYWPIVWTQLKTLFLVANLPLPPPPQKKRNKKKIALCWPPTWRPCYLVATKNWFNILPSDYEQSLFFL